MKIENKHYLLIGILGFILSSFTVLGQENVTDYLSIGNKTVFNAESYNLKWSSKPSANYYNKEYLRAWRCFSKLSKNAYR